MSFPYLPVSNSIQDVWLFTVSWSLIFTLPLYLAVFTWMFTKSAKLLPILAVLLVIAAISIFVGGSIAGVALALIYNTGKFAMSSWIPPLWGLIQAGILLLGIFPAILLEFAMRSAKL